MIEAVEEPLQVSMVIAIYKEHQRILRGKEHPNGEDFLRERLRSGDGSSIRLRDTGGTLPW